MLGVKATGMNVSSDIPTDVLCIIGTYAPVALRGVSTFFRTRMDRLYRDPAFVHIEYLRAMRITPNLTALRFYFGKNISQLQPKVNYTYYTGFEPCWQVTSTGRRCRHMVRSNTRINCWVHRKRPQLLLATPSFIFASSLELT
jgi:hypothetical protein